MFSFFRPRAPQSDEGYMEEQDDIPINPENNPPESISDLLLLIDKLQYKADRIKSYLNYLELCSSQGQKIDLVSYKKSSLARVKTLSSLTKLQRILKDKKMKSPDYAKISFTGKFFEVAKSNLDRDVFKNLYNITSERVGATLKELNLLDIKPD